MVVDENYDTNFTSIKLTLFLMLGWSFAVKLMNPWHHRKPFPFLRCSDNSFTTVTFSCCLFAGLLAPALNLVTEKHALLGWNQVTASQRKPRFFVLIRLASCRRFLATSNLILLLSVTCHLHHVVKPHSQRLLLCSLVSPPPEVFLLTC